MKLIDPYAQAIAYAEKGWHVVPLHHIRANGTCTCDGRVCNNGNSAGKHPRIEGGLSNASADPHQITEWWKTWPSANVAVLTGRVSGIAVLDIDPGKGGFEGLAELERKHGKLPPTLLSRTGSGGNHHVFKYPEEYELGNKAGTLGVDGVDFRGNRGYIVAPPSNHRSGNFYEWEHEHEVADMPPWLLQLLLKPQHEHPVGQVVDRPKDDATQFWLDKVAKRVTYGNRNDTGFWLAAQMRDSGVSRGDAERAMEYYATRIAPEGDDPYTVREALATCRSVYSKPPRPRAESLAKPVAKPPSLVIPDKPAIVVPTTATELEKHFEGIERGEIVNIPWPYTITTALTQSNLPGSTVTIVGDPGVGKTYLILDSLIFWDATSVDFAVLFLEKDRRFYAQRLLAALMGDGRITTYTDIARYPHVWREGMHKYRETLERIGRNVYTRDRKGGHYTPERVASWVRQMASSGKRIIVIDPVTMMDRGQRPWEADQWFVDECQEIAGAHGCTIIFVTHPNKGNRKDKATVHDTGGGAAWVRFADSELWLTMEDPPVSFKVQTLHYGTQVKLASRVLSMLKTRDARGAGKQIALNFHRLRFVEEGLILGESDDETFRQPMEPDEIGGDFEPPM